MGRLQDANSHQQRGSNGDDGLHVVIDGDYRRAQRSLANHREDIADECADTDDIAYLPPSLHGDRLSHNFADVGKRERQQYQRSPREHVFVDCKYIVAPDERIEERQIESE